MALKLGDGSSSCRVEDEQSFVCGRGSSKHAISNGPDEIESKTLLHQEEKVYQMELIKLIYSVNGKKKYI